MSSNTTDKTFDKQINITGWGKFIFIFDVSLLNSFVQVGEKEGGVEEERRRGGVKVQGVEGTCCHPGVRGDKGAGASVTC